MHRKILGIWQVKKSLGNGISKGFYYFQVRKTGYIIIINA